MRTVSAFLLPNALLQQHLRNAGVRAGWPAGSDAGIEKLAAQAQVTTATKARESVYRQIQLQLNQRGPFFPLIQPTQVFVSTTDLRNAVFNAVYQVDVTQVSSK